MEFPPTTPLGWGSAGLPANVRHWSGNVGESSCRGQRVYALTCERSPSTDALLVMRDSSHHARPWKQNREFEFLTGLDAEAGIPA